MATELTMGRPASLAARVTGFVAVATTIAFFAFGWIVVRSLEHHFEELDAEELAMVADSVQLALAEAPDPASTRESLSKVLRGHHSMFLRVADEAGRMVYATAGPDLTALAAAVPPASKVSRESLRSWSQQHNTYRGTVLQTDVAGPDGTAHRYTVAVATSTDIHQHYIRDFQRTLWGATAVMSLIALLAAWLAVQQGHAPLRRISARMRDITSEQLHVRLKPEDVPIELSGLVDSFNAMLGQIEDGFRQLSNFSADIAHELRTPITNLTTQTQVALSQARATEEYREVLYSNLEEFERMSKMIGDMLFLASTDNHERALNLTEVDLVAQVEGLFDYFEAWAEERGVSLAMAGEAATARADPLMLRRALANLMSNAIRYTRKGGTVTVDLRARDEMICIRVQNPGEDIPPEHLPHLFDRFYRVDPSRQHTGEGSGLGLAIVKSIADLHQGQVHVSSGGGLTFFEICLPLQPEHVSAPVA